MINIENVVGFFAKIDFEGNTSSIRDNANFSASSDPFTQFGSSPLLDNKQTLEQRMRKLTLKNQSKDLQQTGLAALLTRQFSMKKKLLSNFKCDSMAVYKCSGTCPKHCGAEK
jgi:hypothetical protein